MLRLRRENGGDAWVKKFFQQFGDLSACRPQTRDGRPRAVVALGCCRPASRPSGTSAPSSAARGSCRYPKTTRGALAQLDWREPQLDVTAVAKKFIPSGRSTPSKFRVSGRFTEHNAWRTNSKHVSRTSKNSRRLGSASPGGHRLICVGFVSLAAMTVACFPWSMDSAGADCRLLDRRARSLATLLVRPPSPRVDRVQRHDRGRDSGKSSAFRASATACSKQPTPTVDWLAPASLTAWWLAGYGTMQMAQRVGGGR